VGDTVGYLLQEGVCYCIPCKRGCATVCPCKRGVLQYPLKEGVEGVGSWGGWGGCVKGCLEVYQRVGFSPLREERLALFWCLLHLNGVSLLPGLTILVCTVKLCFPRPYCTVCRPVCTCLCVFCAPTDSFSLFCRGWSLPSVCLLCVSLYVTETLLQGEARKEVSLLRVSKSTPFPEECRAELS